MPVPLANSGNGLPVGKNRLTKQPNVQQVEATSWVFAGQAFCAGTEPIPNEFLRAKLLLALHMYLN